jgi:hypothetical protein
MDPRLSMAIWWTFAVRYGNLDLLRGAESKSCLEIMRISEHHVLQEQEGQAWAKVSWGVTSKVCGALLLWRFQRPWEGALLCEWSSSIASPTSYGQQETTDAFAEIRA